MNISHKKLMRSALVPVGFILCVIGVMLPWRARNVYLNVVVGPACDMVLRSEAFVSFFMSVGFKNEGSSRLQ